MSIEDGLDIAAIEERAAAKAAATLKAEMERKNRPAPTDPLEAAKQKLIDQGVDESAIENFLLLQEAVDKKKAAKQHAEISIRSEQEFVGACYQATLDALDEVLEPLPALKDMGDGFRADLAEEVATLVMKDEKFADVKKMVDAGRVPPVKKLREAAAQIADAKAKKLGLAPKAGQLDLNSSKPQPKEDNLSADELPPAARKFYTLMKNLGKSETEAMARARQHLAEMK